MLLGGIDDVSVCNLENELPKQKARANREREREREGERFDEARKKAPKQTSTSQLQTLRRW